MPTVRITQEVTSAAPVSVAELAGEHPKAELVQRGGERRLVFPYAPLLSHDGLARRRSTRERVGLKPLVTDDGRDLRVISLEALFAHRDHQRSVEGLLRTLEAIAEEDKPVKLRNYGPAEDGWYVVSSLSISDVTRQHGSNLRTRATASFVLTEDPDVDVKIGPASGGHKKGKGGAKDRKGGKWPKSHTVKAGDTLAAISVRYYDEASSWRRIADANGIRDPRKLQVGKKLKIPRPE